MADNLVRVHNVVLKKSERCKEAGSLSECGFLVCAFDTYNSLHIVDLIVPANKDTRNELVFLRDQPFCKSTIDAMLPEGLFIGGIYLNESENQKFKLENKDILTRLEQIFPDKSIIDPDSGCFFYFLQTKSNSFLYNCSLVYGTLKHVENIAFVSINTKINHKYEQLTFHLQKFFINMDIAFDFNLIHIETIGNPMKIEFIQALEKFVKSKSISFNIRDSESGNIILHPASPHSAQYKSFTLSTTHIVTVCNNVKSYCDESNSLQKPNSPYFYFRRVKGKLYSYKMRLRSAVLVSALELPRDEKILFELCSNSLIKQVNILLFKLRESDATSLSSHTTMLFHLPSSAYPISCFIHDKRDNNLTLSVKKLFGLNDVMVFIAPHLSLLPIRDKLFDVLISPHKLIKYKSEGEIEMVKGKYAYFHYGSQGFSDQGWGCAYRSLQTIYSWFILNGYVNDPKFPTITDIQRCLVELKDKPESIIGSKQWIGSVEIGMVLEKLVGIQYRIQTLNLGSELSIYSRIILQHFNQFRCPIMIGGNNYAHTILGIDFNSITGDTKYLVADPHYVGQDDQTIIKKEFVGWKGELFFKQTSSYNIIFPIPNIIV